MSRFVLFLKTTLALSLYVTFGLSLRSKNTSNTVNVLAARNARAAIQINKMADKVAAATTGFADRIAIVIATHFPSPHLSRRKVPIAPKHWCSSTRTNKRRSEEHTSELQSLR